VSRKQCAGGCRHQTGFRRFEETFAARKVPMSPTTSRRPLAGPIARELQRPLAGQFPRFDDTFSQGGPSAVPASVVRGLSCLACGSKCKTALRKAEDDCEAQFEVCCDGIPGCGGPEKKAHCNMLLEWCQAYGRDWYDACMCKCEHDKTKCFPTSCLLA
jgi:hypothetical protein